jgi:D-alanyl-D-alanine dipeptidase
MTEANILFVLPPCARSFYGLPPGRMKHTAIRACRRCRPWVRIPAAALVVAVLTACGAAARTPSGRAAPRVASTDVIAPDSLALALMTDVQTIDSSILVELRYATSNNFTGAPLPGYEANRAYLRREAASELADANRALADFGLVLKVWDAYRPARATDAMGEWARLTGREDLFRDGYISARSRHNVGAAVDVTLVDRKTGRELEMGTAYDTFSSAAHTANATGEAASNRNLLLRMLERVGFTNYEKEWWHFSYPIADAPRFDLVIR